MSGETRYAPEWQPIETAPKDGVPILLGGCDNGPNIRIGYWGDTQYLGSVRGYVRGWTTGGDWDFTPTHWMPLPEPPEQSS